MECSISFINMLSSYSGFPMHLRWYRFAITLRNDAAKFGKASEAVGYDYVFTPSPLLDPVLPRLEPKTSSGDC